MPTDNREATKAAADASWGQDAQKSEKLVDVWPAVPFETRLLDCLLMLHLHGAITDTENLRAKYRIKSIIEKRKAKDAKQRHDAMGTWRPV
jgi:hypothetical protein